MLGVIKAISSVIFMYDGAIFVTFSKFHPHMESAYYQNTPRNLSGVDV